MSSNDVVAGQDGMLVRTAIAGDVALAIRSLEPGGELPASGSRAAEPS